LPCLRAIVIAGVALVLSGERSIANDTKAVFAAGGLQFVATDELRMEEERLVLSPTEVAVSYRFKNLTSRDVTMTVAFPLPDIDAAEMSETPHSFHSSANDGDIFNFRVFADGKPVAAQFEARAFTKDGAEVTELLRRFGVPLVDKGAEASSEVWEAIRKLDPAAVNALEKAGALMPEDDLHHPNWVVKAAYHWEQSFLASGVTAVEHRYEPVLGGSLIAVEDFQRPRFTQGWCPDQALANALRKLPRYEEGAHVAASWLDYVLKTGANWAGPISRFRLEIKKGDADLVSLCPIPGLSLRKEGRSFVADARDFTPRADLKVMFVSGNCQKRPCLRE
jgi:hypothetical protein